MGRYIAEARNLTTSQRANVAAKLETYKRGRPDKDANLHDCSVTREQAAKLLNVSPRIVADAKAIRDGRLYREPFSTFEEYCQERWGIARRSAYQLMDAAKVVENVRNCAQLPATESQARPLAKLEPERQAEVWESPQAQTIPPHAVVWPMPQSARVACMAACGKRPEGSTQTCGHAKRLRGQHSTVISYGGSG